MGYMSTLTLTKNLNLSPRSGHHTPLRVALNSRVVVAGFFHKRIHVWSRGDGEQKQVRGLS